MQAVEDARDTQPGQRPTDLDGDALARKVDHDVQGPKRTRNRERTAAWAWRRASSCSFIALTHARDHRTDLLRVTTKFGVMELSEMQRLKQLKNGNRRLKQIVAEQTLDIHALKAMVAKAGGPIAGARRGGVSRRAAQVSGALGALPLRRARGP